MLQMRTHAGELCLLLLKFSVSFRCSPFLLPFCPSFFFHRKTHSDFYQCNTGFLLAKAVVIQKELLRHQNSMVYNTATSLLHLNIF